MIFIRMLFIFSVISCSNSSNKGEANSTEKVFDKERVLDMVLIKMPLGLNKMTFKQIELKYPLNVRPKIAYSNQDITATFSFNEISQTKEKANVGELLPIIKNQFEALYPQISWLSSQIVLVDNTPFIEYEFISPTTKKEVYSLVYFTSTDKSLLVCTFNCTLDQKDNWQEKAKESMQSIELIN